MCGLAQRSQLHCSMCLVFRCRLVYFCAREILILLQQYSMCDNGNIQHTSHEAYMYLKKNQSTPRPSEHPPVMGGEMSKRLGGIKDCKYKTSSWHLNRFPDADNIGSTV